MTNEPTAPPLDPQWLATARQVAIEAGTLLVEARGKVAAESKGPRDLVTDADRSAQRLIRNRLLEAFPDHLFLGEEQESEHEPPEAGAWHEDYTWVVDPLDGTMNFVHGIPHFAVSIALLYRGQPLVGVIRQPMCDATFWAEAGGGSWLNGEQLRCSACHSVGEALVAISLAAHVDPDSLEVRQFVQLLEVAQGIRRMGSAALNLAHVAAGWLDGYWAWHGNIWDVAAGWLMVQEAGGSVLGLMGDPFDVHRPHLVAAGTDQLARELIGILNRDTH